MTRSKVTVHCQLSTNDFVVEFADPALRQPLRLWPGVMLVVAPLDNRKVVHRGRLCWFHGRRNSMAWVEFLDTGDYGQIHWADLDYAPASPTADA